MAVRQEPLKDGKPVEHTRKQSAMSSQVIPRGCAAMGAVILLWFSAVALLVASTFGNYVLFVGGWERVRWPADEVALKAALLACLFQGVFSVAQWGFKALRLWPAYAIALLVSVIPSFLAYNEWAGPWLAVYVGFFAPFVVFLTAVFVDMLPEWILIR
jgi:hypothetical protein